MLRKLGAPPAAEPMERLMRDIIRATDQRELQLRRIEEELARLRHRITETGSFEAVPAGILDRYLEKMRLRDEADWRLNSHLLERLL